MAKSKSTRSSTNKVEKPAVVAAANVEVKHKRKRNDSKQAPAKKVKNNSARPVVARPVRKAGDSVFGVVSKSKTLGLASLALRLGPSDWGRVCITHLADDDAWVDSPLDKFTDGQVVRAVVLRALPSQKSMSAVELSMRPSLLTGGAAAADAELASASTLPQMGGLVKGFVATTTKPGCFVRLSRGVTARVAFKQLADNYVKDVKGEFPTGKLVAGRVVGVDEATKKVDLSLKSSKVLRDGNRNNNSRWTWESIAVGAKLDGRVRKVERYGVFVELDDSARLCGLCHHTEAADEEGRALEDTYTVGDPVKVVVLSVDLDKKRICLGMKQSYFTGGDATASAAAGGEADENEEGSDDSSSDEEEGDNVQMEEEVSDDDDDDDEAVGGKVLEPVSESSDDDEDSGDENDNAADDAANSSSSSDDDDSDGESSGAEEEGEGPSLQEALARLRSGVGTGSGFGDDDDDDDVEEEAVASDGDDDDDEDGEGDKTGERKHKSSRERERARKRAEAETRAQEEALLDPSASPQNAEDYERLLLSSPNSSFLWISFMALRVSQADVARARALGERALRTIHFREEGEKLNVWVALLNLEHKYGDETSFDELYKRMEAHNDPKVSCLKLAELYAKAGESVKAEAAYRRCIKKTKGLSKVAFLELMKFRMELGDAQGAREALKEALQRLPSEKYVSTVVTFARMEYSNEHGDAERGRTLMEGLIDNYAKRTDVWHQYVDMETKFGDVQRARRLHERATTIKASAKKIKTFFKKWLAFERKHGDAEAVAGVKAKARAFAEERA